MGSITHLTDEEGKILNNYTYDAFGNTIEEKETVSNRYKYAGQQYDPVTNQYYLRARYYNPVIGRFTQEDVYRGDGLNLYAYCKNNPIGYYDPSGYMCQKKQKLYDKHIKLGATEAEAEMLAHMELNNKSFADFMNEEDAAGYEAFFKKNQGNGPNSKAKKPSGGMGNLLDNDGNFFDNELESNYQKYLERKAKEGKVPRDRLDWKEASDMWDKNRAAGRAYEIEKFSEFSQRVAEAQEQITIEVTTDTGKKIRTRVDAIGYDSNNKLVIQEYKASLTAPLTDNQKKAFEIFKSKGGVVVGKGKGEIFKAGFEVPKGTIVDIVRKSN